MQRIRDTFRKRVGQPVSSSDSSPIGSLEQQAKAEVDRLHRHRRQILMQKQLKQQQLQSSKFGFGSSGALVTLVNNDRSGDSSPTNFLGNSLSPKSSPSNSVFDGKFWLTDNEFNEEDYDFKIRSKNDFFDFDTIEIEINRSSRDEKRELGTNLDDSTTGSTGNKKSSFIVNEFSPEPPELFSSNRNDPTNELKSVDYQKSLWIEENQRDVPNPKYYQNVRSKSVDPSKPINILSSSAPSNNVAPTLDKTIQFPPLSPTLSSSDLLEIDSDYVGKTALQNRSDSATSTGSSVTFLDVPKWKLLIRRSSGSPSNNVNATVESSIINRDCVHCLFLEELDRDFNEQHQLSSVDEENRLKSPSPESSECSHNDDDGTIKECSTQSSETCHKDLDQSDSYGSGLEAVDEFDADEFIEPIEGLPIVTLCPPEAESTHGHFDENVDDDEGSGITVISLEVPVIGNSSKQSRSASVDSPYLLQVPKRSDIEVREGPPKARSKSVDIVLPLNPGGPYLLIPPRHPPTLTKKTVQGEIKIQAENGETRVLRSAPDWTESAILGDHIWVSTSTSGSDLCYVGETKCSKTGPRLCCPACKVIAHTGCISILIDNMKFQCKPTFKDGVRQYREHTRVKHHWVHRRHEKGRCKHCGKNFQSKLSFGNKEIVAVSCSWCKFSFHNKEPCFSKLMLEESCDFGLYRRILVPSSWIVKLPRKGSFKSSIRRSPKNKRVSKKRNPGKLKLVNTSLGTNQLDSLSSTNTSDSNQSLDDTKSIDSLSSNDPSLFLNKSRTIASKDESFSPETNSKLLTIRSKASRLPHKSILAERIEASNRTLNDRPIKPQGKSSNTVFKDKSTMVNATASNASRSKHRRHSHANITSMSGSNLSSTDGHRNSLTSANNRTEHYLQHVHRSFVIKPIPSADLRPLLVFINPKSGGNQGAKLMQKFQWHLNPRQIFDLSQGGPRLGLDLFKKVHNLRILACGGDGTAGWVLSAIDEIAIQPPPPISVLPLGTGNDLARAFGWGGSYTDEPISKILCNIQDGKVVQLDRWNLKVQPNLKAQNHIFSDDDKGAKCNLPLDVVNNYFSIGVDAHIALSFHEAREAHPEKFNSRLRNKMFYGQAGGKDLLQRKWKDLCNYVNLECDGKDFTGRLKELKVHSVLFLNIPSYGGGTRPWPSSSSSCLQSPKTDDGFIEVIGLTTYQLPLLQAGGHGTIITQCRSAKIETSRTIPMQVDGEPCRLNPSLITLELRNKANLIANTKTFEYLPTLEKITLKIRKLNLNDYETYHYDKEHLKEISIFLGSITIEQNLELNIVRFHINELMKEIGMRRPSCDFSSTRFLPKDQQTSLNVTGSQAIVSGADTDSNTSFPTDNDKITSPTAIGSTFSASSMTTSSLSAKFISNDWCFVDSVTAERFFRIDRAQEDLYYVVDICHQDLFILDPQFDEKDDLDYYVTDEIISQVEIDDSSLIASPTKTSGFIEEQSYFSIGDGSLNSTLNESNSNPIESSSKNLESLETALPDAEIGDSPNHRTGPSEPYREGLKNLEKIRWSIKGYNDNGLSLTDGVKAKILVQKNDRDVEAASKILSPQKKSPKIFQKNSPKLKRFKLQNQLMLAAKNGDLSLLRHLHQRGVNLMLIDEKGMTALHYAVLNDQEEAVSFLANAFTLEMINKAEPENGHTALHKAVLGAKQNISVTLVICGARLDLEDFGGHTVEQLCRNSGQFELLDTLIHIIKTCDHETVV